MRVSLQIQLNNRIEPLLPAALIPPNFIDCIQNTVVAQSALLKRLFYFCLVQLLLNHCVLLVNLGNICWVIDLQPRPVNFLLELVVRAFEVVGLCICQQFVVHSIPVLLSCSFSPLNHFEQKIVSGRRPYLPLNNLISCLNVKIRHTL
jgi:hypothetical protein